tara:strand:+ start:2682 stop:4067 length:1386 start_codon:yes stop_codon:yes gene_type:complete
MLLHIFKKLSILNLAIVFLFIACEDFLEPETPLDQMEQDNVFANETTATAAVTTLYGKLRDGGFLNGSFSGNGFLFGLYADELDYHSFPGSPPEPFYLHQVLPTSSALTDVWNTPYNIVYSANAILEGIETATALPEELKRQLRGEALFVRGFCHFHLVNVFGDVPYIKTTDYTVNATIKRMPSSQVYDYIITDLLEAKSLLGDEYVGSERVRPNSLVVSALLARMYLYTGDWANAQLESTRLINSSLYTLDADINNVFLKESPSTIWQFKPLNEGDNTAEAKIYVIPAAPPSIVSLNPNIVADMEAGDLRKTNWIGEVSNGSQTWYFPFKYKEQLNTGTSREYSKVFRLVEQYLIRAEARAMMGNISGAQQDLNLIRNRVGLENTTATTSEQLRNSILSERRFEFFTEFGHRWFDLRRMGMAEELLAPIKPGWRNTDLLLPIPESELLANSNLNPQNPGY